MKEIARIAKVCCRAPCGDVWKSEAGGSLKSNSDAPKPLGYHAANPKRNYAAGLHWNMWGQPPSAVRRAQLGAVWRVRRSSSQDGRRGRNRTCNRRIRNPMLYPFELRARKDSTSLTCESLPHNKGSDGCFPLRFAPHVSVSAPDQK